MKEPRATYAPNTPTTWTKVAGFVKMEQDSFRCSCGFSAKIWGGRWIKISCPKRRWWCFWQHRSTWHFTGSLDG